MGTKATAKDMVKICDEILGKSWSFKTAKEIRENLEKLVNLAYNEARAEEIIKKIIEQSKRDLIRLIQTDEAFTKDEEYVNQILQTLKKDIELLRKVEERPGDNSVFPDGKDHLGELVTRVENLVKEIKSLLVKDADIADAVQIISRDLEKLMQTLRKTER